MTSKKNNVGSSLRTAKTALVKTVTALAAGGHFEELRRAAEALQLVDMLLSDNRLNVVDGLSFEAREMVQSGRKIEAIKLVRASSGMVLRSDGTTGPRLGLKDAKDLVEAYMQKYNIGFGTSSVADN